MEFILSSLRQAANLPLPDKRQAADTASLAQDNRPQMPMPIGPVASASNTQETTIIKAMIETLATGAKSTKPVDPIERTLKPYGIGMLPKGPAEEEIEQVAEKELDQGDEQDDRNSNPTSDAPAVNTFPDAKLKAADHSNSAPLDRED